MQNVAPRLSATPGRVSRVGPELGKHNGEILGALLGIHAGRLDELARQGVIGAGEREAA
jgi:formyl-CoA transferase